MFYSLLKLNTQSLLIVNLQTILHFVVVISTSVANDVDVYVYNNVANFESNDTNMRARTGPKSLFEFDYRLPNMLQMKIYLKNEPPNVDTVLFISETGVSQTKTVSCAVDRKYCEIKHFLLPNKEILRTVYTYIELEILSIPSGDVCTRQTIVKGKRLTTPSHVSNTKTTNDICFTDWCVIEVDLRHVVCADAYAPTTAAPFKPTDTALSTTRTDTTSGSYGITGQLTTAAPVKPTDTAFEETTTETTSGSDDKSTGQQTLIYVISSVVGICVIILAIYISVKKYHLRNLRPVETVELDTYATVNEVVYADLSLAHGGSQPPRREETPYAQIIGVMRPVDGKSKRNRW